MNTISNPKPANKNSIITCSVIIFGGALWLTGLNIMIGSVPTSTATIDIPRAHKTVQ